LLYKGKRKKEGGETEVELGAPLDDYETGKKNVWGKGGKRRGPVSFIVRQKEKGGGKKGKGKPQAGLVRVIDANGGRGEREGRGGKRKKEGLGPPIMHPHYSSGLVGSQKEGRVGKRSITQKTFLLSGAGGEGPNRFKLSREKEVQRKKK